MKSARILIVGCILLLVAACGSGYQVATSSDDIKTRCLNGVTYYLFKEYTAQGYGFMAPKYNRDGTLSLCN